MLFFTGIYLTVTIGMTSLSIILTVCVRLHYVGPHQKGVPKWLRFVLYELLARLVCMRQQVLLNQSDNNQSVNLNLLDPNPDETQDRINSYLKLLVEKQDLEERHQGIVNEWRLVAMIMDRVLFWVFLLAAILSSIKILIIMPMQNPPVA